MHSCAHAASAGAGSGQEGTGTGVQPLAQLVREMLDPGVVPRMWNSGNNADPKLAGWVQDPGHGQKAAGPGLPPYAHSVRGCGTRARGQDAPPCPPSRGWQDPGYNPSPTGP